MVESYSVRLLRSVILDTPGIRCELGAVHILSIQYMIGSPQPDVVQQGLPGRGLCPQRTKVTEKEIYQAAALETPNQ
jgi:hypothetical protein